MKKTLIKYLCIISVVMMSIGVCYSSSRIISTYSYPAPMDFGIAGSTLMEATYKVDTDKKTITFNNWSYFSVSTNNGYSLNFKSRDYQNNSNGTVTLICEFYVTLLNTHQTSVYRASTTVNYNDVSTHNNIQN